MARRVRLLVVVVLSLELFSTRAARAGGDASAALGAHARRTKAIRLELTWAAAPPPAPPLIPPVSGATVPNAPALSTAPQGPHVNGAQVAMAVLITLVGDTAGLFVAGGTNTLWAGAIPWAIAPFGAAALVCNAGSATPGRCRATLAGALIGAAVGLLPGMLILASARSNGDETMYIQNRLTGFETTFVLYGIGVPLGTIIGYGVGGTAPPNPVTMPPVASVPLFTLRF